MQKKSEKSAPQNPNSLTPNVKIILGIVAIPFIILILAIVILVISPAPQQPVLFTQFTSDEGQFTTVFPGNPTTKVTDLNTTEGIIVVHTTSFSTNNGMFSIVYNDYPDSVMQQSINTILDSALSGSANNTNSKIISKKDLNLQGYLGKEGLLSADNYEIKNDIYLVKNRLYQVMIVTSNNTYFDSNEANTFFNSFRLND